jgi:hypothetical protein
MALTRDLMNCMVSFLFPDAESDFSLFWWIYKIVVSHLVKSLYCFVFF